MLPAPDTMDELAMGIELSEDQMRYFQPKMVETNQLILSVNDRCAKDANDAEDVLNRLNTFLNDRLKLDVAVVPINQNAKS